MSWNVAINPRRNDSAFILNGPQEYHESWHVRTPSFGNSIISRGIPTKVAQEIVEAHNREVLGGEIRDVNIGNLSSL